MMEDALGGARQAMRRDHGVHAEQVRQREVAERLALVAVAQVEVRAAAAARAPPRRAP
jgi:hypothetical protein